MSCQIAESYYFPHGHLQQTSSRQPALQDLTLWRSQNPYTQPRCSHEYRSASNCEKKFWLGRQYRIEIGLKGKKPLESIDTVIHTYLKNALDGGLPAGRCLQPKAALRRYS